MFYNVKPLNPAPTLFHVLPPFPLHQPLWMIEELSLYPSDCMVLFVDLDVIFQEGWDAINEKYSNFYGAPKVLTGAECKYRAASLGYLPAMEVEVFKNYYSMQWWQ